LKMTIRPMSNPKNPTQKSSVFLYGPSGSGKSTVGKILAESLNLDFVDLDLEIETLSGMPIPEIFASQGEPDFREWEHQALVKILTSPVKVVALGGGALTAPRNRELVEANGRVVLLTAAPETLLSRLQDDRVERPLLSASPNNQPQQGEVQTAEAKLKALLERRAQHYASFGLRINTGYRTPVQIAWDIQVLLGRFYLQGMASIKYPAYDVIVQPGGLDDLGWLLQERQLRGPVVLVTDDHVAGPYLSRATTTLMNAGFETSHIQIPAGEKYKTLDTVSQLWGAFGAAKIERSSTIVALGGGVIGDLTGFAAASWLRGAAWVVVPTSLLAMVDASMGGKTGFDLPQGKNLIGAFYPPRLVLADPDVLATLPQVERINGMAEVLKHGVIADPGLFEICRNLKNLDDLSSIVSRAMAVKVKFIEEDPYEQGIRAALNLGHTVGHGVELASGFKLRHGEAVAIGMVAEARMAERIGLAKAGLADEIAAVLKIVGLPTEIPAELDRNKIIGAMTRDKKKAGGVVKFALPVAIGDVSIGIVIKDWSEMLFN
jgi:shikimate kinase / 3-dehydroquinate synthase